MNAYQEHYQKLEAAKSLIGRQVTAQRPGTYNAGNKITGTVVGVRESIADYSDPRPAQILVDIQHYGTVTPCHIESVTEL